MADTLQKAFFTTPEYSPFLANLAAPAVVTFLAYVLYIKFMLDLVKARRKHKIPPPAMTGHPDFERYVRVYENQLEQYVPFLSSMYLTAIFVNGNLAGVLGLSWVVFRLQYGLQYQAQKFSFALGRYTGPAYVIVVVMHILPLARILYVLATPYL